MKNFKFYFCLFSTIISCSNYLSAQKTTISESIKLIEKEGYSLSQKINDRYYFLTWKREILTVKILDENLKFIADKELITDKKLDVQSTTILPKKENFVVVARMKKKGIFYIRAIKYDWNLHFIDSSTVYSWHEENLNAVTQYTLSEDKKVILVANSSYGNQDIYAAFSLDSLKNIWTFSKNHELKNKDTQFEQWVVANSGIGFFIKDDINWDNQSHIFNISKYYKGKSPVNFTFATGDNITNNVNFSFDNKFKNLMAVGVYVDKIYPQINGVYVYSQSLSSFNKFTLKLTPFKDDFVSEFLGKKITDNKGIENLKVQRIIHRSDGGVIAIFEQARDIPRNFGTTSRSDYTSAIDYYYENICPMAFDTNGDKEWHQIFKKYQSSQDDNAVFSSFFLVQNPTSLRIVCNDRISKETRVNAFLIKNSGDKEQHTAFNTQGKDLQLIVRAAIQTDINEVLIPSQILKEVKLVRINWDNEANNKANSKYK